MERDEFKMLVKGMKAVYADSKFIADKDAFDVWYSLLKDLEYGTVSAAIQKHMMTSRYPPTIADIREQCASISQPQPLDELEAWSLVRRALRNCGYNYEEEYRKLPLLVQRAIGVPGQLFQWATDEEYNEGVVSSNFMRSYRAAVQSEQRYSCMNDNIRREIDKVNTASPKAQIEAERQRLLEPTIEDRQRKSRANTDAVGTFKKGNVRENTEPVI